MNAPRIHGGPGRLGPARLDFSTTSNACGPCPAALVALRRADHSRYPDPDYHTLRQQLAALHRVTPARIVLAASASEFIFRATAISGEGAVSVPPHAYGDYATAAMAYSRPVVNEPAGATLAWFADPGSPLGESVPPPAHLSPGPSLVVLDRACEPLRLQGRSDWKRPGLRRLFQLYSPNKALGLTGVRAAYAIAPTGAASWVQRLAAACPSWPLGAAGVALLSAWVDPAVQAWLADSRLTLVRWKRRQIEGLTQLHFRTVPSVANFFLVRPPIEVPASEIARKLAAAGIAWRDTTSFGLPGAWRVSVQSPAAQGRLFKVLRASAR